MSYTPEIDQRLGFIEGYGGPGRHWTKGIFANKLLWSIEGRSEGDVAVRTERERVKWEKDWASESEFRNKIASYKDASSLCSNCGLDTLDGGSSCLGRTWCQRPACEDALETARVQYAEDQAAHIVRDQQRAQQNRADNIARINADTMRAFHWRDGWFFARLGDGSVRVMLRETPTAEWLRVDIAIPPIEWASIVSSVSAVVETGDRWKVALNFHGAGRD